jgi:hypothetical protein
VSILEAIVKRALGAHGWIACPEQRVRQIPHERHLQQVFAAYRIDCVLDVGAHLGRFRDVLRDGVGYTGPIVSFEPSLECIDVLMKRAATERSWRVFPIALGSESRVIGSGSERLNVCRLDEVFLDATVGIRCRHVFLRLGARVNDVDVMSGAGLMLNAVSAMQTELSPRLPGTQDAPDYLTSMRSYNDLGFEISGLFPMHHDCALRATEMDCVMVRQGARDR